jgi:hypothetical protein
LLTTDGVRIGEKIAARKVKDNQQRAGTGTSTSIDFQIRKLIKIEKLHF